MFVRCNHDHFGQGRITMPNGFKIKFQYGFIFSTSEGELDGSI